MKTGSTRVKYFASIILAVGLLCALAAVGAFLRGNIVAEQTEQEDKSVFGKVVFNEMLLSNDRFYPAPDGEFYDYIELHNTTGADISLSGWYITEGSDGAPWHFPGSTVISADGYIIVYFSGETKNGLYAPMKLSKQGSEIFTLFSDDGLTADRVVTAETERNLVYERTESGSWRQNAAPSPLFPNTAEGKTAFAASRVRVNDPIKITEIMAQNLFTLTDEDGDYSDYIEISNLGEKTVNLDGYTLSNDENDFFKWRCPKITLEAGESVVLFASGKDRLSEKEPHLSFRLAADGDSVFLCDASGALIDSVSYLSLENGSVLTKTAIGDEMQKSYLASPGYLDTDEYCRASDAEKELLINEVMVVNDSYVKQNAEYFDWIELKNNSGKTLDLSDYYLTKNKKNPLRFRLPAVSLAPGQVILVFASGDNAKSTSSFIHCDFKLDSVYDELYLYKSTDSVSLIDGVVLAGIPYKMSYGRSPSKGGYVYIPTPTPGTANSDGFREIAPSPVPSVKGGIYDGIESVNVSFDCEGTVFYTLDGSLPTERSAVYSSPLTFTSTCVIRAVCKQDGKYLSPASTNSYIINENHTLPVVSLSSDPYGLWSEEEGICNRGIADAEGIYPADANIRQDWERACSVELFDGIWGFSADCGVKLFGQSNREYPKQSFQLKFRAKYGTPELFCALFDETPEITEFESLVLRSGSQDYRRTTFRDELCTSLAAETGLLVQGYKACVLYINGEYYGLYYIREKIDENFIASHLDVSAESVDLLVGNGGVIYGSSDGWYDLLWYVQNYDVSLPDNYSYIKKKMDVESFADFIIAEAFFGNRDSGNIKFYRSSETDGKWRWILYDLDYGMTEDLSYNLQFITDPEGTGYAHKYNTKMINALLKNAEFFDMFLRKFAFRLQTTYSAERVIAAVDSFRALISGEIERNIEKWGNSYRSYDWQTIVIKNFVSDGNDAGIPRSEQLISEIKTLFSLDDETVNYYFYMTDDERVEYDLAAELEENTSEDAEYET